MDSGTTYRVGELGFSMTIPSDWSIRSLDEVRAERAQSAHLVSERLQQATLPFLTATRHSEAVREVNPTVQVVYRSLPAPHGLEAAANLLKITMWAMGQRMPDFEPLSNIMDRDIGGLPAIGCRAQYTVGQLDNKPLRVLARMWMVPRGENVFMFGLSGPAVGEDVCEFEFQRMLVSVRFDGAAPTQ